MTDRFKVRRKMPSLPKLEGQTPLSFYDTENPDVNLFNLIDDEIIRISGSLVNYFKAYNSEDHDDVYLETTERTIASEPITVHAHYEPAVIEEILNQFGIQMNSDQLFVFNKSYIESEIGRSPQPGDVIEPHFQKLKYEIVEVQEDKFDLYGVYHMLCTAKVYRDSESTLDQPVTERIENVKGEDLDVY
jgi:hypothetical protein